MTDTSTGEEILAVSMPKNDAGAATIRDYLVALLSELWRHEEGFNGKRPFGNGGWQYEVYIALAESDWIEAEFDEWGWVAGDIDLAYELVQKAIAALGARRRS